MIWRSVRSRSCSRLAYGAAVIAFVRRHPCGAVRRVLATVYVGNFAINLSSVTARFAGAPTAGNAAAVRFTQLAASPGAGGIADLLLGASFPLSHGRRPPKPQYYVTYLADNINALYAWYRTRPASTRGANSLAELEHDLSFSRLVS